MLLTVHLEYGYYLDLPIGRLNFGTGEQAPSEAYMSQNYTAYVGNNKGMGNPHGLRVWVSLRSGSGWSNKLPMCKPEPIHIPMGTLCRVAHFADHDSSCHLTMSVIHASIRLEL